LYICEVCSSFVDHDMDCSGDDATEHLWLGYRYVFDGNKSAVILKRITGPAFPNPPLYFFQCTNLKICCFICTNLKTNEWIDLEKQGPVILKNHSRFVSVFDTLIS